MTVRSDLRHEIARGLGDLPYLGTASSGTTTTLLDTTALLFSNDDSLNGMELYIYGGTGDEQTRKITDSDASASQVTFATGTAPDTTSTYEIHRYWKVAEYNSAIDNAHDAVLNLHLIDEEDESEVMGNLLSNGLMATWTASTGATACTDWTADSNSTLTRESSILYGRYYAAKLVTDGSNIGTFSQSVADFPKYAGEDADLYFWIYCATASRVTIRLTDGVNTWNSDAHDGTDGWADPDDCFNLESKTISESATELTASAQVSAGAAVTIYIGRAHLFCPAKDDLQSNVRKYYKGSASAGFLAINEVWQENTAHNYFSLMSQRDWSLIGDKGARRLYIPSPTEGRAMRVAGQRNVVKPTADTSDIELNDAYVTAWASMRLLQMKRNRTEADNANLSLQTQQAYELRERYAKRFKSNSVPVD